MIRLRIPAGRISAEQMFNLFEITDKNATGVVKITTRQTVQLHGVIKSKLKPTIQFFDKWDLDSIAACGDINRNVVLTSNFTKDSFVSQKLYPVLVKFTKKISEKFLPQGGAYQEILNKSKILEKKDNVEPIYGAQYLPRKFKIAIAIPPPANNIKSNHKFFFFNNCYQTNVISINITSLKGGIAIAILNFLGKYCAP